MLNKQEVGLRIKEMRGGLSQVKVGEAINFSSNYISDIEKGKSKPSLEFLFSFGDYFMVSIDYLLRGGARVKLALPANMNTDIHTQAAKRALGYLNKCANSIIELDTVAHVALEDLEAEVRGHGDPEVLALVGSI